MWPMGCGLETPVLRQWIQAPYTVCFLKQSLQFQHNACPFRSGCGNNSTLWKQHFFLERNGRQLYIPLFAAENGCLEVFGFTSGRSIPGKQKLVDVRWYTEKLIGGLQQKELTAPPMSCQAILFTLSWELTLLKVVELTSEIGQHCWSCIISSTCLKSGSDMATLQTLAQSFMWGKNQV